MKGQNIAAGHAGPSMAPVDAVGESSWPKRGRVVRHGETSFNLERRATGPLDPALADRGRDQAPRLAEPLFETPLAAVHASTLARGIETARPTAESHGPPVRRCVERCEQDKGALRGRLRRGGDPRTRRLRRLRRLNEPDFRFPGGDRSTI